MPITTADLDARAAFAEDLVREAGRLALRFFDDPGSMQTEMKGFQDYVTAADGSVEMLLRQRLAEWFPSDGFYGEEGGGTAADALWIADPIDGTDNFARRDLNWCISLGYVVRGVPEIGLIFAPSLGELYVARRGRGAARNGKPIAASRTIEMKRAAIEIGWSARRPRAEYVALVEAVMEAGATAKRSGSGALGLMSVAGGRTDGNLERHINSWDVAAGLLIAREAGAVCNNFFSGDWLAHGNPVLAAAPGVAGELAGLMGFAPGALLKA